jgi:nitrous oxide reductase accessory protein NosL
MTTLAPRLARLGVALLVAATAAAAVTAVTACTRSESGAASHEERCARCGMAFDAKSPFEAELVAPDGAVTHFDSPRCALLELRTPRGATSKLRVREFYDTAWRDADREIFVAGSDVKSPMGADFVPVDPEHVEKFMKDNAGKKQLRMPEITTDLVQAGAGAP